jgi:multidrug resistance efflux pump
MVDDRIPIPPSRRWSEFRIRLLPGLVFLVAGVAAFHLWNERVESSNLTGKVIGLEVELRSTEAGYLTQLQATRFQRVNAGDAIAQVVTTDPRVLEARLAVVLAEVEMIRHGMGPLDNYQRNVLNLEGMQMDLMRERIALASSSIERDRVSREFERARELRGRGLISEEEFERVQSELDMLALEIGERSELLDTMRGRIDGIANNAAPGGSATAAALRLQEERLRLIEAELMPVTLEAPIDGVVSRVFRSGGERIAGGEPILVIQSRNPEYIVGYIPHPVRLEPVVGMSVVVRSRSGDREEFRSRIIEVGAQVEDMAEVADFPPRPGQITRTGLPVKIDLPTTVGLRPGEIVDLTLTKERGGR